MMKPKYNILSIQNNNYNKIAIVCSLDSKLNKFLKQFTCIVKSLLMLKDIDLTCTEITEDNQIIHYSDILNNTNCFNLTDSTTNMLLYNEAVIINYKQNNVGDIIVFSTLSCKINHEKIYNILFELDNNPFAKNIIIVYFDDIIQINSDENSCYEIYINNEFIVREQEINDSFLTHIGQKLKYHVAQSVFLNNIQLDLHKYQYLSKYQDKLFIMHVDNDNYDIIYSSNENVISNYINMTYEKENLCEIIIIGFINMLHHFNDEYIIRHIHNINTIFNQNLIKYVKQYKLQFTYNYLINMYTDILSRIKITSLNISLEQIKNPKLNCLKQLQIIATKYSNMTDFNHKHAKYLTKQNKNITTNIKSIQYVTQNMEAYIDSLDIEELENIEQKYVDQYLLLLSRTSWNDEIINGNIIGMMINIKTSKLAKLGNTMDRTEIACASNNFISLEQMCDAQEIYHDTNRKFDDGRSYDHAMMGAILGNGNSILPLYINNMHWTLAKYLLNFCMGLIVNQYPFDYCKSHYEIYPMTLLNFYTTMIQTKTDINDKNIIMLIQLIITNNLIFKEQFKFKLNYNNMQAMFGNTLFNTSYVGIKKSNDLKCMYKTFFVKELYKYIDKVELMNICAIDKNDVIKMIDILPPDKIFNINIGNLFQSIDTSQKTYMPLKKVIGWHLSSHLLNDTAIEHLKYTMNDKYGYITDECIQYFKEKLQLIHDKFNMIYTNDKMILHDDMDSDKKLVCLLIMLMTTKSNIVNSVNMINMKGNQLHIFYVNLVQEYLNYI